MNWYISRDEAKRYIGAEAQIDNKRIDILIEKMSRSIDKWMNRFFYPKLEERLFDYQEASTLLLDCDLISITTLYKNRKDNTIDGSNILLYSGDSANNPPYYKIFINPSQDFFSYTDYPQQSIAIDGVFGYCNDTENTTTVLSSTINNVVTTMAVADGSKIEVGWTLLIDDEQIFVSEVSVIDSTANIAEDLDTYETLIGVDDGSKFNANEIIKIDSEYMKVLVIAANTLTVQRGYGGTAVATHTNGSDVYVFRSFTIERAKNGTTAAEHTSADIIYRYVPPQPIVQAVGILVARADKRSDSAWADIIGATEFGTPMYFKHIPDDVKDLIQPYRRYDIGSV